MSAINEKISFIERSKHTKNFRMPGPHFHNHYELYFLLSGETKYFINDEIFVLNPGDLIFVPKNTFHKTDSEEGGNVERILFSFDDDLITDDYKKYITELSENKHVYIKREHLSKIYETVNKIEHEEKKQRNNYRDMQKLYFYQLLILISRHRQNLPDKNLSETCVIINSAARYINENCTESLSLDIVSKKYALSPWYFSKLFKQITGVGFNEYMNICRISRAQQILGSENVSITEVAQGCGFNDSNYFAQVFKKITGLTPKKYAGQFVERDQS